MESITLSEQPFAQREAFKIPDKAPVENIKEAAYRSARATSAQVPVGTPPTADKKVIQQTFRQLASKPHPDVNPGIKDAEEKFKTINEAYNGRSAATGFRLAKLVGTGWQRGAPTVCQSRRYGSIPVGVRTAGGLYLIIKVLPNEIFERDGDDLQMDASVDIFTAIVGGEIRIPAVERPPTLKIPPCTNASQTIRLRSKCMLYLREANKRGDMFVRVKLVLPHALTDQGVDSIQALASARQKQAAPNEVK